MKLLLMFGIGAKKILANDHSAPGRVTGVELSSLYVIKKPVRLGINERNTLFSHFIHFTYCVEGTLYRGKLFVSPHYRCPQKDEILDVYYDPRKPERYAFYSFGPASLPMGW